MKRITLAIGGVLLQAAAATAAPEVLTTCGATVSDAVLAGDLDCSGTPGYAVTITDRGSLDLAGHRLISSVEGNETNLCGGVSCERDCTITGHGGSIEAAAPFNWDNTCYSYGFSIPPPYRGRISVSGVTFRGYSTAGEGWK